MLDNKYRREHVLPLYRSEANRTIEGLKFYLETLESFIETEREREISNLQKKVEHLSEDDQGEFWAWRYPIHWDDIFATHLRASFIVTLMSLAEFHLNIVAEQASEIASTPLKARDLRGSSFEKDRKLLEALAGFRRPSTDTWNSLHEVREIRNCIVHADSTIYRSHNEVRLKSLVAKLPGLSTTHGLIEMSNEFPQHCLAVIKNFLTDLYEEASDMCQKFV
jgi:hypothetical protein